MTPILLRLSLLNLAYTFFLFVLSLLVFSLCRCSPPKGVSNDEFMLAAALVAQVKWFYVARRQPFR